MLLSKHTQLVAAFNHMHIFIDPNPDASSSYQERKRLFALPRSTWEDYNSELISKGGGIFSRSAKSISLTPEIQKRFDIKANSLTPNALISELLKAPVDLLWNGGIGTYIKARSETHADVGDKTNDVLRVDANELRCRVVGEGGNLGISQLARVEYGLHGGAIDTDFIDNAGGVDCSDHEVNIKILLNGIVANGDMTEKQRNKLLESMTDAVSDLVLDNNYKQVQAISLAEQQAAERLGEYRRFISALESGGKLDRQLEFLPDDESMLERKAQGKGLTRPELSVLISYSKGILKEELASCDLHTDKYCAKAVETAFPQVLRDDFKSEIYNHRLLCEIIATQVSNDMVNHLGITFFYRMKESTGSSYNDIARAYITARDTFGMHNIWRRIESMDHKVAATLQMDLMSKLMRLMRRSSRWFLRNRRSTINVADEIQYFAPAVEEVNAHLSELLQGDLCSDWQQSYSALLDQQIPEDVARFVAGAPNLYMSLGVAEAAKITGASVLKVAHIYFILGDLLELHWFAKQVVELKVESHWHALARETFLDDLDWQQRSLAVSVLKCMGDQEDVQAGIDEWMEQNRVMVDRWKNMLTELHGSESADFAMYSVALRELLDLAQTSTHREG